MRLIIHDGRFGEEGTADDANSRSSIYWGLGIAAFGGAFLYVAADILASLSIGLLAIVGVAISLLVRGKAAKKGPKKLGA